MICFAMMISIILLDDIVPFIIMNVVFFGFNAIYQPMLQSMINMLVDKEKSGISVASGYGGEDGCQGITTSELQALIDNGTLPKINPLYAPPATPTGKPSSITLQVGTNGDSNSQITFDLATTLAPLEITITDSDSARTSLTILDNYLSQISDYQTNFGAVTNRLESALDEITIQYENLASSRSTIRDADMAELSSTYIQQQILQEASATILSTAKNIQYQNVLGLLQGLRG
jgi:flagellin-like hook-associated protein FlgL